jgi:hypothetical protein
MKEIVADAIRFYYGQGNDSLYLERSQSPLAVAEIIRGTLREFNVMVQLESEPIAPGYEVQVSFGTYARGAFDAEFVSTILVSKLVEVFHVVHFFSVKNRHEQRVEPTLDGYGGTGFIMPQFDMHEALRERLIARGYTELDLADMEEIIPTLSFPEDVTIFGRQVSVQVALFRDLRRLCPED